MPRLYIGPDRSITLNIKQIKNIGVQNIAHLNTYAKSQIGDRIMRVFEFEDGGTCEVTYLASGDLEFFSGRSIQVQADDDGNVMIGQLDESAGDGSN